MEKHQVTIAVRASGLMGRVGAPMLLVTLAAEENVQTFVILAGCSTGLEEVARISRPIGPLASPDADYITSRVDDVFYERLLAFLGVQPVLPVPVD